MSKRFCDCDLQERLQYTSFLLLMGLGYLMALAYLYTSHSGHDGEPGLSVDDVVMTYYGNRSGSRLEAAIRGPMSSYLNAEQRSTIVTWLQSGAERAGYELQVAPILTAQCLICHGGHSGAVRSLADFSAVSQVAEVDTGASIHSLLRVSHIHLFGIGLVVFAVGMVFRYASLPPMLKSSLILLPYGAVFIDILAWFLTKWDPFYAYTVIGAGALLGIGLAAQILISLYQMWFGSMRRC